MQNTTATAVTLLLGWLVCRPAMAAEPLRIDFEQGQEPSQYERLDLKSVEAAVVPGGAAGIAPRPDDDAACVRSQRARTKELFMTSVRSRAGMLGFCLLTVSTMVGAGAAKHGSSPAVAKPKPVQQAVDEAHAALWSKFVSPHGFLFDYVGELPTPEDCALGRPNFIGWLSPIENASMFTGLYLPAVCERARRSGATVDKDRAKTLAQGLLKCASISDVPGFIGRGVGTDGRCHYPLGSEDQTFPWFYGLHTYAQSGIPTPDQRRQVVDKMAEVANALEATNWRCPCDGAFRGQFRGHFKAGAPFRGSAHYLFALRAMYDVTGDKVWLDRYLKERVGDHPGTDKSRLEICAEGYTADRHMIKNIEPGLLWIYVGAQGALRKLAEMETDETVRAYYRKGLDRNAANVLKFVDAYQRFDNQNKDGFSYAKWREGYAWRPQKTQDDAERVAVLGRKEILGTRKGHERSTMTNPLSAAAIVAMAGRETDRNAIERAISHYDYTKINLCEFFLAECAYYALPPLVPSGGNSHQFGCTVVLKP